MKKRLIAAACAFIVLLAVITALLCAVIEKSDSGDYGRFAVAANEIEQLIESGQTDSALVCTKQLKNELSAYSPEQTFEPAYLWAVFAGGAIIVIAVFIYIWFAIIRPFEKLTGFAERIAGGDLDLPLDYQRTNYFGRFTWAFDSMRREIVKARTGEKEAIENNKTIIATLSHDIKTPVASIRAYAEGLEAGMDTTAEKRQKYLSVIMNKCDEVTKLTNDMFLHSLSDLDKLKMNNETIEFCSFAEKVICEIGDEYGDISFIKPDFSATVNADKNRLTQIFGNVITNARKYAKTKIDVSITLDGGYVSIHFRDHGNGIPDEDIPFIFGKFYRGKNCGSEQGSGLGLYIVKYVAEQSMGTAKLRNCDKGLEVTISLPVKNA